MNPSFCVPDKKSPGGIPGLTMMSLSSGNSDFNSITLTVFGNACQGNCGDMPPKPAKLPENPAALARFALMGKFFSFRFRKRFGILQTNLHACKNRHYGKTLVNAVFFAD
jgi:hypothetical protein